MKKVLFASTALVAFAGAAAAAEVTISGDAEMGIVGGDAYAETQFFQTFDITFSGRGTTDGGLTFGANVDLTEAGGNEDALDDNGFDVFISGAFGTLTLGDTDGAMDWALTDAGNVGNPGSIADDETSHAAYIGAYGDGLADGQILRYDNTFGAVGFAVSVELDDTGVNDTGYAVGVRYALDLGGSTVNLGLAYQQAYAIPGKTLANTGLPIAAGADVDIWGVSASGSFGGGFSAGIQYTSWEFNGIDDTTHVGVGIGYESGPIALHLNYGTFDSDFGAADGVDGWGMAAAYDLGGGAGVHLGVRDDDINGTNWSLGVAMSF